MCTSDLNQLCSDRDSVLIELQKCFFLIYFCLFIFIVFLAVFRYDLYVYVYWGKSKVGHNNIKCSNIILCTYIWLSRVESGTCVTVRAGLQITGLWIVFRTEYSGLYSTEYGAIKKQTPTTVTVALYFLQSLWLPCICRQPLGPKCKLTEWAEEERKWIWMLREWWDGRNVASGQSAIGSFSVQGHKYEFPKLVVTKSPNHLKAA